MKTLIAALIGGALVLLPAAAGAKTVTIEMKNFVPGVGSKATDAGHNVQTMPSFAPADTSVVDGKLNQDQSVTFAKPCLYGFKCIPHYSLGMVALVRVGNAAKSLAPLSIVEAMPPLAKKRITPLLAKVS